VRGGVRVWRWLLATALLVWFAAPHWPDALDDVYISAAYAHEWVGNGSLQWTTGEVVEGYSNFLMVGLMAAIASLGGDVGWGAQAIALCAGVALLGYFSWLLPRGWAAGVALAALAVWAPLAHWSATGMETTLYALFLSLAWSTATRGGTWGAWSVPAAVLASLARPEGMAMLGLVVLARFLPRSGDRSHRWPALFSVAALGAYHLLRSQHFGAWLPTSILVKISGVPGSWRGLIQVVGDVACAAPLVGAFACVLRSPSWTRALFCMVPFAFQAMVVTRASGDWMTWARLLLPGIVASLAAWAAIAEPRGQTGLVRLGSLLCVPLAASLAPVGYGEIKFDLRRPLGVVGTLDSFRSGLDTPLDKDVLFASSNVAAGGSVLAVDAGMLGNVPNLRLIDPRGLTHRAAALAIARGDAALWFERKVTTDDPVPDWVRVAHWGTQEPPPIPSYLRRRYSLVDTVRYPDGATWWFASTEERATSGLAADRLLALSARYPSQPFLVEQAALALVRAERWGDAIELVRKGAARASGRGVLGAAPSNLLFAAGPASPHWVDDRGFALFHSGAIETASFPSGWLDEGHLVLDQDAAGASPARARIELSGGCHGATEVAVAEMYRFALSSIPCDIPSTSQASKITVVFLNDEVVGDKDRNLYVQLFLPVY
jgi:hypothetical protein